MRKIATYLSAIVLLTACITNNRQNNRILYVSIQPLQSLVDSIVGGDFEVEVLVPAGASPETFEPTPRQFVELNEAQLIFNVGLIDFETSLLGKVEQQEKVIDLSRGIDLIEGSCSHSSHGHNHTHGVDPHVWTSPKALQKMAANAFEAIRKAYPDSVKYETNYNRLQKELQALDARTAEKITRSGIKYFIVYHRPHLLCPRLRTAASRHRNRRQGAIGQTVDGNHPESPGGWSPPDILPKAIPGIDRGGHSPRHRRRIRGD